MRRRGRKTLENSFQCPLTCDYDTKWPRLVLASCDSPRTSALGVQSGVCRAGGGRRTASHKPLPPVWPSLRWQTHGQHQGNKPLSSRVLGLPRRVAVLFSSLCLWKCNIQIVPGKRYLFCGTAGFSAQSVLQVSSHWLTSTTLPPTVV